MSASQDVPAEAREVLARWEARVLADNSPEESLVEEQWKWIPLFLMMPVERESSRLASRPWLTWTLASITCLVNLAGFFALYNLEAVIQQFGLIPAGSWRYGGLTFLTSFFLHDGLFHLTGNLYFLMIFGDNVEDYLGKARYLLVLLLAAFLGDVLHIFLEPHSTIPSIGASGGISGLIAFYALQFPEARLVVWVRWFFVPIRARLAFFLWIFLQLFGAWQQLTGASQVSSLAHLGGAIAGLLLWWKWRKG